MDQTENAPVHRLVHRFWNVAENSRNLFLNFTLRGYLFLLVMYY
jgi:hypothetical protein